MADMRGIAAEVHDCPNIPLSSICENTQSGERLAFDRPGGSKRRHAVFRPSLDPSRKTDQRPFLLKKSQTVGFGGNLESESQKVVLHRSNSQPQNNQEFHDELSASENKMLQCNRLTFFYSFPVLCNNRSVSVRQIQNFGYFEILERAGVINIRAMRFHVACWMLYVQHKPTSSLSGATFHIAVHLLDRYMSAEAEQIGKECAREGLVAVGLKTIEQRWPFITSFQNIGASCLFVAAKLHEERPMTVRDLCLLSDDSIPASEILRWEKTILSTLDYQVNVPTALDYLSKFHLWKDTSSSMEKEGAVFLCDLFLLHADSVGFSSFVIAAASMLLTMCVLQSKKLHISSLPKEVMEYVGTESKGELRSAIASLSALLNLYNSNGPWPTDAHYKHKEISRVIQQSHERWCLLCTEG